ncbi:MAG: hypothetical protein OXH70_17230 [Acidobacteria bacterium]|nr:hypothetical protein [Acidobacteriota bacterium]
MPHLHLLTSELQDIADDRMPHDLVAINISPGMGKALALSTPILTTGGWSCMGDIKVGDHVFGVDGSPRRVNGKSAVFLDEPCYELRFDFGETIVACQDHLWLLRSREDRLARRSARVRTTLEVAETVRLADGPGNTRCNYSIDSTEPIEYDEAELLVPPYTLGAWLGDGSSVHGEIHGVDEEVFESVKRDGFRVGEPSRRFKRHVFGLSPLLRAIRVHGNKHIPAAYQRGSVAQRISLLQGLMDTDGHCTKAQGRCEFTTTSKVLAEQIVELIIGLGIKTHMPASLEAKLDGRVVGQKWRVNFAPPGTIVPFRIKRKVDRLRSCQSRTSQHWLQSCERTESVPTQCISVDGDQVFLVGRQLIPTHNSMLAVQLFAAYYLRRHPDRKIFICANTRTLAHEHSREVRKNFALSGGRLSDQGARAERWKTVQGGGIFATAPGAAILGWHYHLLIVDDPFDKEKEAFSVTRQEYVWNWWNELDRRRMRWYKPGEAAAPVCRLLIHQRLAVGDLAGRILREEKTQRRGMRIVYVPGIMDREEDQPEWPQTAEVVTLPHVEAGEPTAPDFMGKDELLAEKKKDPLAFEAVYQQNPKVGGAGDYFSRDDIRLWPFDWPTELSKPRQVPMFCERIIRSWDFGYSLDGDWTSGVKVMRLRIGKDEFSKSLRVDFGIREKFVLLVCDVKRKKVTPRNLDRWVHETIRMDGSEVEMSMAQDPGAGAKTLVDMQDEIKKKLGRHSPTFIHTMSTKDGKLDRSRKFRRMCSAGLVFVVPGPSWVGSFIDELEGFVGGNQPGTDDMVDAASDAIKVLTRGQKDVVW